MGFVFDFNYKYTFKTVYEKDYINKIIDRLDYKSSKFKNQINEIKKIVNDFIKESIV